MKKICEFFFNFYVSLIKIKLLQISYSIVSFAFILKIVKSKTKKNAKIFKSTAIKKNQ